jgi:hypothetical protein
MSRYFNNVIKRRSTHMSEIQTETTPRSETASEAAARHVEAASIRYVERVSLLERKLEANGPQLTDEARAQVSAWLTEQHDRLQAALTKGRDSAPPLRLNGSA